MLRPTFPFGMASPSQRARVRLFAAGGVGGNRQWVPGNHTDQIRGPQTVFTPSSYIGMLPWTAVFPAACPTPRPSCRCTGSRREECRWHRSVASRPYKCNCNVLNSGFYAKRVNFYRGLIHSGFEFQSKQKELKYDLQSNRLRNTRYFTCRLRGGHSW